VMTSFNNMANVYQSQGDYPKALECHEKSLRIRLKALGPDHPHTMDTHDNRANVYVRQGDTARAKELFTKCVTGYTACYGASHSETLDAISRVADCEVEPRSVDLLQDTESLIAMGFTEPMARKALAQVGQDAAAAAEYIVAHLDEPDDFWDVPAQGDDGVSELAASTLDEEMPDGELAHAIQMSLAQGDDGVSELPASTAEEEVPEVIDDELARAIQMSLLES
jgi:tetratricopeptide (TPR) repeat protein